MALQWPDFVVAGIMLLSGLLALMRGFVREVLSLIAWGGAALAGLGAVLSPDIVGMAKQYLQPDIVAQIAVGAGAFLIVLMILTWIGVKVSDWVTDSAVGPVDRTLGLVYGLARGLVLVVLAWLFYIWLIPPERHDPAVQNAKSLPLVQAVGDVVISFLPSEIAQTLQGKTGTGAGTTGSSSGTTGAAPRGDAEEGYSNTQQRQIDQIIESTQGSGGQQQEPASGGQDQ